MDKLKFNLRAFTILLVFSTFTGCDSAAGKDSLLSRDSNNCTFCHGSGVAVDPLASGNDRHNLHINEENLDCEECHFDYIQTPTHNDGNLDKGNTLTNHVNFDSSTYPDWEWDAANTSCLSIDCHGDDDDETYSWLHD